MLDEYKKEAENYNALWKLYARNSLQPDFRKSLYSTLALVFVPSLVNVYYIFRQSILKNAVFIFLLIYQMRFGSIFTCITIFHYNLNQDFEQFLKKDTKESNLARVYIQNISANNVIFPYFQEETLQVVKQREFKNESKNAD